MIMTDNTNSGRSQPGHLLDYIHVLKPRETSLLVFIAACTCIVAAKGFPPAGTLIFTVGAVLLGSAGCNGITNYLDMRYDARMRRTCSRVLPSGRIKPPEKVLPEVIILIVAGLVMAWNINVICFVIGLVGSAASVLWRKTITCTYFGIVAGCAPVLIGWFAIRPYFELVIALLCLLIAFWIPLHVWTLMLSHREDYARAGLCYFPLTWPDIKIVRVLIGMSFGLFISSIALFFTGELGYFYLGGAVLLGGLMAYANLRLMTSFGTSTAWKVYKLSAFPYLGIVFLVMCIDLWLR
jgi:protoheme IX farnesyltransferase